MKSGTSFSAWPMQDSNDYAECAGRPGRSAPLFFSGRAHLLTTGPEGRRWYPSRWSGRALLAEAPPGLSPEGPTMPQAAIVGAVPSVSYFS